MDPRFPDTPAPGLTIHLEHDARRVDADALQRLLERVAEAEGHTLRDVSIVLTDHAHVLALNRDFLQHDYHTDVLSFLLDDADGIEGEVYVDLDTAAERHDEFGADYEQEAFRYAVHGLLHLFGHDDATDAERAAMRALEDRYLGENAPGGAGDA